MSRYVLKILYHLKQMLHLWNCRQYEDPPTTLLLSGNVAGPPFRGIMDGIQHLVPNLTNAFDPAVSKDFEFARIGRQQQPGDLENSGPR